MKHLFIMILSFSSLFAFGETLQSFQADFVQQITDEEKKILTYTGTIKSKRPSLVLWHYTSPVDKKIYVNDRRAVIIEPELEQAIIKQLHGEIDFFGILASAVSVDMTHYKASYKGINFLLKEVDGVIESLSYTDQLENQVVITFSKQQQNRPLDDSLFIPKVPNYYDVIRE